jgi:hypothetical protein
MRTQGFLAIGAALILTVAAGAYTGQRLTEQQIEWTWGVRAPNFHPGFALHFNERTWEWLSGRPPSALANTILSDRTDTRLTAVIEYGLRKASNRCPGHWLLARIHVLPDQSVFVSGYCATKAELEKARELSHAVSSVVL